MRIRASGFQRMRIWVHSLPVAKSTVPSLLSAVSSKPGHRLSGIGESLQYPSPWLPLSLYVFLILYRIIFIREESGEI